MSGPDRIQAAGETRRLYYYNAGFLRQKPLRAILGAAGWDLRLGLPSCGDHVAVWGRSPYAKRGEAVAQKRGLGLIRVEDAFVRSVHPGRAKEPPLGLLIDPYGVHFDSSTPSLIEHLAMSEPLDDTALLQRSRDGMARLRHSHISKYNNFDPNAAPPAPGYVLVIDQTRGDASITYGGASARLFREMLGVAQIENPGARILIKTHPETQAGYRPGHYGPEHCDERTFLFREPISPWALLEGATAVYTVSSLLGYEAILAGHKPRVFGQPFYASWGLTQDENPVDRRRRRLTRAQLFAVSHILAPTWFDPCRKEICSFEVALDQIEADLRSWRADRHGYVATGISRWKHRHMRAFFGQHAPIRFRAKPINGQDWLHWSAKPLPDAQATPIRVEDGFLRSRGLGARLVPPLSLVTDTTGIYYDPTTPSELEALIAAPLPPGGRERADKLLRKLRQSGLSKYNQGSPPPELPAGHRILVPGQVEDDASIRLGCAQTSTNLALLAKTRAENPDKVIIFKPHPDVEAGLRPGAIPSDIALRYADYISEDTDPVALIAACDEVWTMTSLMGFEALLRGKPTTCLGAPFYAGWGLTHDLSPTPARRTARPDLVHLVHAVLIAYPRYFDPVSQRSCPPELVIERLADRAAQRQYWPLKIVSTLQDRAASWTRLWR
ncbi:capsular biosynthesis protein [Thioclava sp. SK-1]|uniref:capsular polysaccharide biosynthesis protein n=1 Tax=Thioclava sp. SK-1 TaxID=1889770 RepID=UPI0008248921|nr:capsular polysaccharide biosynthesis protein [Thioclava sp. SK-1]OCX66618.1 capsular biosynthesis protein [Thioclava sp. SK-1]